MIVCAGMVRVEWFEGFGLVCAYWRLAMAIGCVCVVCVCVCCVLCVLCVCV